MAPETTQTLIHSFRINRKRLDEILSIPGGSDRDAVLEISAPVLIKASIDLHDALKAKGYDLLVSWPHQYHGAPHRVLVVDPKAPFSADDKYDQKVEADFLEAAAKLNLPYEKENSFIDLSLRRL